VLIASILHQGPCDSVITFRDHPEGTAYSALAMHRDRQDRDRHEQLGFHDGWTTVAAQLAELVEAPAGLSGA
jgi:uncharacterized protein YndB with AHSA1/START domain